MLVLEYDGANYCGFQFQINGPTVQDEIEKALLKLTGEKNRILAASRTDAGVHAKGQVISFRTGSKLKTNTFIDGMNYYLPQNIAVIESYSVRDKFNVQKEAVSREYSYFILNSHVRSPLRRSQTYLISNKLDLEAMEKAGRILEGNHDFASFVTQINKSTVKNTIRMVYRAQIKKEGDLAVFNIVANSFLPHQVRNIVGSLIKVGLGKINKDDLMTIMEERKPGLAGPTIPAQGLFLMRVNYPRPLEKYHDEDL